MNCPKNCHEEYGRMRLSFCATRLAGQLFVTPSCSFCGWTPPIEDQPEIIKQLLEADLPRVKKELKEIEKYKAKKAKEKENEN